MAPWTQAQDGLRYGIKLGLSAADLRSDDFSSGNRWGLNAGAFLITPLPGPLGLLAEASYHQKGYGFESEVRDDQNNLIGEDPDFRYDYVSALAAAQYGGELGDGPLDLYFFAGPRFAVKVLQRYTIQTERGREAPEEGGTAPYNDFALGASAGLGLDLGRALGFPVLVELRYNGDVTPAFSLDTSDDRTISSRWRTFDFRVGLSF